MLKKRLAGLITVLDGWAVQSIGYKKYLPLGRPEIIAENLERWGVDEILILSINRSKNGLGPDIETLNSINLKGLNTPISYGGGISSYEEAIYVIKNGAERIVLDSMIKKESINEIIRISEKLGSQSLIASLPSKLFENEIIFYNYHDNSIKDKKMISNLLKSPIFSELLIIDYQNEGIKNGFNDSLIKELQYDIPAIVLGGISEENQIKYLLSNEKVASVGIGNFLNYKEHAIQTIKKNINLSCLREAKYVKNSYKSTKYY